MRISSRRAKRFVLFIFIASRVGKGDDLSAVLGKV